MDDLDLGALIPSLESLMGSLDLVLRVLVMMGPLALLASGLYYFLAAPKEANWTAGYRFRYGMARVASWQFMQKLAGIVYSVTGLLLTVVMAFLCARFKYLLPMDMVLTAGKMIVWEVGVLIVATLGINITVMIVFDHKGRRRKK